MPPGHGGTHPPFTQPPHVWHTHHLPQVQFFVVHLVAGLEGEACLAPELVPVFGAGVGHGCPGIGGNDDSGPG